MFFPVFLNIENKKCLVIGGGKVAFRKINKLLKYKARLTVISKNTIEEIKLLNDKNLEIIEKEFEEFNDIKYLKKYFLIIAATNDKKLNDNIANICIKENILINNVSSKDNMNCRFGVAIEKEEYSIAVSAKGNPKKAIKKSIEIKENIENLFNE
ncbi:bifunctional precorrin-2 dehydrogenase/sirohydrochlorin ferrochelatase [uncultured Brachyspira sp.]|uniref:precorrin-2 dehydrogenase/sirohydrochlorin ferrochelatase family protein n=1 Tax=uncultured Brachyspira sp. TaxID=221953 RepID=UPI00259BBA1D|nr:bifunctional precorrin-2 dehydrogenase/sirohydrochlorin ferrochelatase [uncultured Brachyspira sp.]